MNPRPLTIVGNEGSPYSRKLRAVLRYRQLPHRWTVQMGPEYRAPPKVAVAVIPVLVWHDDDDRMVESMVDSTPIIHRLEREFTGRSLVPPDPALAFLDALIEDYADEWCAKFMFHYRWAKAEDCEWARLHLMRQINPGTPAEKQKEFGDWFGERQVDRLSVVGSTAATAPVIEAGYARLLGLLDSLLQLRPFVFGARPAAADFGLFGQLTQLCLFDPTPGRLARSLAPRVIAWTQRLEDLGGWRVEEGQWLSREAAWAALEPLLAEVGATYLPFLAANEAARKAGQDTLSCTIDGVLWTQKVFPYQLKCLKVLRERFQTLAAEDRDWLRKILPPGDASAWLEG